jgi:hypothetical protein
MRAREAGPGRRGRSIDYEYPGTAESERKLGAAVAAKVKEIEK